MNIVIPLDHILECFPNEAVWTYDNDGNPIPIDNINPSPSTFRINETFNELNGIICHSHPIIHGGYDNRAEPSQADIELFRRYEWNKFSIVAITPTGMIVDYRELTND